MKNILLLFLMIFVLSIGVVIAQDFDYKTPGYDNAPWGSTKNEVREFETGSIVKEDWGSTIIYFQIYGDHDLDIAAYYTYRFFDGLLVQVEYALSFDKMGDYWDYTGGKLNEYGRAYGDPVTWKDEEKEGLKYYTWNDGNIIFRVFTTAKNFSERMHERGNPPYCEMIFIQPGLSIEVLESLSDPGISGLEYARNNINRYRGSLDS